MKSTIVARNGILVDKATGAPIVSRRARIYAPRVQSDLPAYVSPRGTGVIEGRAARRNDMAAGNVRETDPSEWKDGFQNERFAKKRGLEWQPEGQHVKRIGDG